MTSIITVSRSSKKTVKIQLGAWRTVPDPPLENCCRWLLRASQMPLFFELDLQNPPDLFFENFEKNLGTTHPCENGK